MLKAWDLDMLLCFAKHVYRRRDGAMHLGGEPLKSSEPCTEVQSHGRLDLACQQGQKDGLPLEAFTFQIACAGLLPPLYSVPLNTSTAFKVSRIAKHVHSMCNALGVQWGNLHEV